MRQLPATVKGHWLTIHCRRSMVTHRRMEVSLELWTLVWQSFCVTPLQHACKRGIEVNKYSSSGKQPFINTFVGRVRTQAFEPGVWGR